MTIFIPKKIGNAFEAYRMKAAKQRKLDDLFAEAIERYLDRHAPLGGDTVSLAEAVRL